MIRSKLITFIQAVNKRFETMQQSIDLDFIQICMWIKEIIKLLAGWKPLLKLTPALVYLTFGNLLYFCMNLEQ